MRQKPAWWNLRQQMKGIGEASWDRSSAMAKWTTKHVNYNLLKSGPNKGSFGRGMQISESKIKVIHNHFIHDIWSSSCAICSRVASSSSSALDEERERKATTDLRASRVSVTPRSLSFCCARLIRCCAVGAAMAFLCFLSLCFLSLSLQFLNVCFLMIFRQQQSFPPFSPRISVCNVCMYACTDRYGCMYG